MLTEISLSQGSLNSAVQLMNTKSLTLGWVLMPDAIVGLRCIFVICAFIIVGKLITEEFEKRKGNAEKSSGIKPLGEIIKDECQEIGNREVNLNIFSHGLHCMVNKMLLYMRVGSGECFLVLHTDNGCLVETADVAHANKEFSFICYEDDAAKEGVPVSINLFNYTLYDKSLNSEIYHYES